MILSTLSILICETFPSICQLGIKTTQTCITSLLTMSTTVLRMELRPSNIRNLLIGISSFVCYQHLLYAIFTSSLVQIRFICLLILWMKWERNKGFN